MAAAVEAYLSVMSRLLFYTSVLLMKLYAASALVGRVSLTGLHCLAIS